MSAAKTAAVAVSSNQAPPANLKDLAAKIEQPLLLIAAPNAPTGEKLNRGYRARGGRARRRCGRSPSPATSAGSRRGPRSTSGASIGFFDEALAR